MKNIVTARLNANSKQNKTNMNLSEVRMWLILKSLNLNFRRQHILGKYIVDFVSLRSKIIVEVDGISHEQKQNYDISRDNFLISQGFKMLKFTGVMPYPTQTIANFVNAKILLIQRESQNITNIVL